MELKEFISETIQQIALGVKDAMGKCESLDIKEIEKYLLEETQIISKPIRE